MLQLRPNCECCNKDLPNESLDARICTFECTFCSDCAASKLQGICPNCGGELVVRPRRPADKLARYPASTERVFKPGGQTGHGMNSSPPFLSSVSSVSSVVSSRGGVPRVEGSLPPHQRLLIS